MSQLKFAPAARRDVNLILDHIARNNRSAALRFVEKIKAKCRTISRFPEMVQRRDDLFPEVRSLPIGNYVIFYRMAGNAVKIIRVLHAARDCTSLVE